LRQEPEEATTAPAIDVIADTWSMNRLQEMQCCW
jgi:hypothetical protein